MPKFKLEGGQEFEIPEGFNTIEEYIAAFTAAQQKLPTLEAQVNEYGQFKNTWGDPGTLKERLEAHVQQQADAAYARAKAEGATNKQANASGDAVWDQWEALTPQQQAQAMIQQVSAGVEANMNQKVEAYWKQAQAQLGQATGTSQQQFDLLARALDFKLKDPSLDLAKVWTEMTELTKATPDKLMEIAMRSVQNPAMVESRIKEERAKWEEESSKKAAAERLNVLNSDSVPNWLKPKADRVSIKDGEDAFKKSIIGPMLQNGSLKTEQL